MVTELLVLLLNFLAICRGERFFTATEMRDLLQLERELADDFLQFYKAETQRLDRIEKFLNHTDKVRLSEVERDSIRVVSHPTDSYKVLQRFLKDWSSLDNWMSTPIKIQTSLDDMKFYYSKIRGFTHAEELRGSLRTLFKLQETYKLRAKDMVNGLRPPAHRLDTQDVYELAAYANHFWRYTQARDWINIIIELNPSDVDIDVVSGAKLSDCYEILSWASYKLQDYPAAIKAMTKSFELNPTEAKIANLEWYQKYLLMGTDAPKPDQILPESPQNNALKDSVCRREHQLPAPIAATLHCSFYSPHPQFYLKPLKQEELFHNPEIVKYHDILSEAETNHIKSQAKDKLRTSQVHGMDDGQLKVADYRISKTAWLHPVRDEIVQRIVNRVGALANLDMTYAEPLQVANYGIGGTYESHYDYAVAPHNSSIFGIYDYGDRIATMLFYLETVESGGDTAFVNIGPGVSAQAVKGSGIYWHNLKRNGEGNPDTKHAACPVLLGEKWVSNLWIHENGQEFRHPCSLNPDQ